MALAIEWFMALLTLAGLAYMLLALWSARDFIRAQNQARRRVQRQQLGDPAADFAPDVTILKPMKGIDPHMYAGLESHCRQVYAGRFQVVFGVSSPDDPAISEIARLQAEYPEVAIRLVACAARLGTSGKVSSLVQMLPEAAYDFIVINDSDIFVAPGYLASVMAGFAQGDAAAGREPKRSPGSVAGHQAKHAAVRPVGMVTVPYIGRVAQDPASPGKLSLWSRLEALGISTDFLPGVLTARKLERGIRFGLGSTLATTKAVLGKIGGLEMLLEYLADDYELGARIARAGYRVELVREVVETTVPPYSLRGFWNHQMRWVRSTRDSRRWGFVGLGVTYSVPWALMTVLASGFALWSFSLLSIVLLARIAVALVVGVGVLRDEQVLRDLWLIPLRDCVGLVIWTWSFAGDTVLWRGERFRLAEGRLRPMPGTIDPRI